MTAAYEAFAEFLGFRSAPENLTFVQVALRGVIVMLAAIVMVRLGDKRFLARLGAFDFVLGLILASMLARAINGTAAFFPTLGGGFVLVGVHRLLGILSQRSHRFGVLVKGRSDVVIKNGCVLEQALRKNHLSEHDLLEELRLQGKVESPGDVRLATVERNGTISVILQPRA